MSKYRGGRLEGGNYVTVIVPADLGDDFIVMDARSHRPLLLPPQHLSYLLLFIIIHSEVRPRITGELDIIKMIDWRCEDRKA